MAVNLSMLGNGFQFLTATGLPLNAGKLYTYQAGSTTPFTTYTDNNGTIANTNPIVLGTDGRPPEEIWLTEGYFYKFVLKDSDDVTIATYDNIYGALSTAPAVSGNTFPSGGIILWSGSIGSIPSGWYLCNGSNGTPDLRDRFVVGAGSSYAVNATGGVTSITPTGSISGASGSTVLTESQIPAHKHIDGKYQIFDATTPAYGVASTTTVSDPLARLPGSQSAELSYTSDTGGGTGHTHDAGTYIFTGNSTSVIPVYFALCYIMKA